MRVNHEFCVGLAEPTQNTLFGFCSKSFARLHLLYFPKTHQRLVSLSIKPEDIGNIFITSKRSMEAVNFFLHTTAHCVGQKRVD